MGIWGWWAFDIFTLMASYVSNPAVLSSQTIMRSLGLLTFMIPAGFSQACGITVGGFIGKGLEKALKYYYWTSMYLSVITAAIQIVIFITLKH